jgi:hypothetical protein
MKSIGDRVDRWVPESALLNHLIRKEHHLPKHPKTIRFGVHEHPEKKSCLIKLIMVCGSPVYPRALWDDT